MELDGLRGHSITRTPPTAAAPSTNRVPTSEQGVPAQNYSLGDPRAFGGVLPWSTYLDEREIADQLRWPLSVLVYQQMQGDAMCSTLLTTVAAPVRRFRWEIDPNGARQTVVEHVASSWNLPIRGEGDDQPVAAGFNHDRHLAFALQALAYGFMYFEEVYEVGDDGLFRLKKLGTRPPRTISNFMIDVHGDLLGIVQKAGVQQLWGQTYDAGGIPLDANRLLAYVWNPADDGDWLGRSALRPCFKNWLVKDRLVRVDATKHERTGMGIPWVEMDPKSTKDQILQSAQIAEELRVSQRGGAAGVGKLRLVGVEGSVPDTVASIRYHDQQMTSAFLAMFVELGKGETGSYALGSALMDFHAEFIGSVADWYIEATMAQIEREVEINWGPGEKVPRLAYTRLESAALSFTEMAEGVKAGLIDDGQGIKSYVAERWKLPEPEEPEEEPTVELLPAAPVPAPDPAQLPAAPEPTPPATSSQPARSALAEQMLAALDRPMPWPALAAAVGRSPKDGTARRARDQLVKAGAIVKGASRLAPVAGLQLPDRELHRNPKPFEVEAAVNFSAMERIYLDSRTNLVTVVREAQATQFAEAAAAVEAAGGDPAKLGSISIAPMDAELLMPALLAAARNGEAAAEEERQAQISGQPAAAAATPDEARTDEEVRERAIATVAVLATGLAAAASKKAAALSSLPPADAAEQTKTYLEGLSDAALNEQLGGAVHKAYAAGRNAVMRVNNPRAVYGSEILDTNTCSPCSSIDGTEWPSVEAAEGDYPGGGGYTGCDGGLRCRGILIAVYA